MAHMAFFFSNDSAVITVVGALAILSWMARADSRQ
jgi:hypothetical protein